MLVFLIFIGCSVKEKKSSNEKKSFTAVVEISAGTNKKYEYNYSKESFEVEIMNGKERIINYLPYPGNYGFITNTYMDPKIGGDGDALDVLIISESIAQGSEVKINPIGILKLLDGGEEDHKVIAIPKDSKMNFIKDSLTHSIKKILTDAINHGGTTLNDFSNVDGNPGYFSQVLSVYGREDMPCIRCNGKIKRIVQNQRATYYCPKCQN